MVWFIAEKQSSIFIEFFNSIGRKQPLVNAFSASALARLLPIATAKSEV
jgi:hypothetical protein